MDNLLELPKLKALNGPILITGHTGFKGSWLIELLTIHGLDVVGLSLPPTEDSLYSRLSKTSKYQEYFADINDFAAISKLIQEIKPKFIFHLAAQALVLDAYEKPFETYRTNVMGTLNIIEAAAATSTCRGIQVITTDKVYCNTNSGKSFVETDPLFGKDPYSGSKVGAESVVSGLQNVMKDEHGLLIQSVRAGNVIGGGDYAKNRLIPDLVRSYVLGTELIIRNPQSTRPWQHVLDPLIGYLKAAEYLLTTEESGPFNFGPNEPSLPVSKVLECALDVLPTKYRIASVEDSSRMESILLEINPEKAAVQLLWQPIFKQEQAIRLTMLWWKQVLDRNESALVAMHTDISLALNGCATKC